MLNHLGCRRCHCRSPGRVPELPVRLHQTLALIFDPTVTVERRSKKAQELLTARRTEASTSHARPVPFIASSTCGLLLPCVERTRLSLRSSHSTGSHIAQALNMLGCAGVTSVRLSRPYRAKFLPRRPGLDRAVQRFAAYRGSRTRRGRIAAAHLPLGRTADYLTSGFQIAYSNDRTGPASLHRNDPPGRSHAHGAL